MAGAPAGFAKSRLEKDSSKLPAWLTHWRLKLALSSPVLFQASRPAFTNEIARTLGQLTCTRCQDA